MKISGLTILAATLLTGLCKSAAVTTGQTNLPGLTHEEYLELLTLNSTEGWEPMSRVPIYNLTASEQTLSRALSKRGGGNQFIAYSGTECSASVVFQSDNFGCGVCVQGGGHSFKTAYLWREKVGGDYPTASWFSDNSCQGHQVHSQGIKSGESFSCDVTEETAFSALLYQGC